MNFKSMFDTLIAKSDDYIIRKRLDKQSKVMTVYFFSKKDNSELFSISYTYKGEIPTDDDVQEMYKAIINYLCEIQLKMMSMGESLNPKAYDSISLGKS